MPEAVTCQEGVACLMKPIFLAFKDGPARQSCFVAPKIEKSENDRLASPGGQLHSGQWQAVPEYYLL